ncbi:MAG: hypothetical protein BA066_03760 [Candidatus Korarchaeota archaeon NZ13-K]|nr:MAG: hypothetical protein BA066_03760 [Candidatus Korarchaeota archaeon NZ13-K]
MERLAYPALLLYALGVPDPIDSLARALSLRKVERVALSKLVRPPEESMRNALKVIPPHMVRGADLGIDGFNVVITVERALAGDPVYICSDGVVRDLTLSRSSYRPSSFFERAVSTIREALEQLGPGRATLYLDSPVPGSGVIAGRIRELMGGELEVRTSKRVDSEILSHEVVATSDSRIMGEARAVLDLARFSLERIGLIPKKLFTDRGMLRGFLDDRST